MSDLAALGALSRSLAGLLAAHAPSVVSVQTRRAHASGFVWKSGLIVTADEALADETEASVETSGGERRVASVVGRDPSTDIALLRAEGIDRAPVPLDGAPPAIGSLVVAVGSARGAAFAALGMVAASGPAWRSLRGGEIDARIELDLSPRREAEGGLAIDAAGHAFGMMVFGPKRRPLVIPAATIARVAGRLETHGRIARGWLGLGLHPIRLDGEAGGEGVVVMSVAIDGPGAAAGLCQGDVITTWNGQPIASLSALVRGLGPGSVGQVATIGVRRGGKAHEMTLTVGERPAA